MRKFNDFIITNDERQWIICREYEGKDKDGNAKVQRTSNRYYSDINAMCRYIANEELKKEFNRQESKVFSAFPVFENYIPSPEEVVGDE